MSGGKNPNSLANLRPIQKGEVRNPAGRYGGKNASITQFIKEKLQEMADNGKSNAEIIAEKCILRAKQGDLQYINMLLNRLEGPVRTETDINVTGNALGVIVVPKKEEIEDNIEEE